MTLIIICYITFTAYMFSKGSSHHVTKNRRVTSFKKNKRFVLLLQKFGLNDIVVEGAFIHDRLCVLPRLRYATMQETFSKTVQECDVLLKSYNRAALT